MATPANAPAALGSADSAVSRARTAEESGISSSSASRRPELEYLKAVNSVAPPQDPHYCFS